MTRRRWRTLAVSDIDVALVVDVTNVTGPQKALFVERGSVRFVVVVVACRAPGLSDVACPFQCIRRDDAPSILFGPWNSSSPVSFTPKALPSSSTTFRSTLARR